MREQGLRAELVDHFKRAEFPVETPAHRAVNVDDVVGDLRHQIGGVAQRGRDQFAHKAGVGAAAGEKRGQGLLAGRQFHRLRRAPGVGFQVKNFHALAAVFVAGQFVETAAGLSAELPAVVQPLHIRGERGVAAAGVFRRQVRLQVFADAVHHIQPDQIYQAVKPGRRQAERRGGERVHGFNGQPVFADGALGQMQAGEHPQAADAVADEVDRVLGMHHALAERPAEKGGERFNRLGAGVLAGHEFHQFHHMHRVEEVGDGDVVLHAQRHAGADVGERNAGGVGGDQRVFGARVLHFAEHFALGFQVFNDRLANPVAFGQAAEVGGERADADFFQVLRVGERRRAAGGEALFCLFAGGAVNVQQQNFAAGRGACAGDAAAHGAGAEHRNAFDFFHVVRSGWSGWRKAARAPPKL